MRNVLAIILLFLLVSTTAYAEGEEKKNNDFLVNNQELVVNLFHDAFVEFGPKTKISLMLEVCGDNKRFDIMSSYASQSIIGDFVMDTLIKKYSDETVKLDANQGVTIIFIVNSMYNGFKIGYYEASMISKELGGESYCRKAVDLYYEKLK